MPINPKPYGNPIKLEHSKNRMNSFDRAAYFDPVLGLSFVGKHGTVVIHPLKTGGSLKGFL